MGWLRLVGSLKLHVSFAKEPYKRDDILQKTPIILRSLQVVATPPHTGIQPIAFGVSLLLSQSHSVIKFSRSLLPRSVVSFATFRGKETHTIGIGD